MYIASTKSKSVMKKWDDVKKVWNSLNNEDVLKIIQQNKTVSYQFNFLTPSRRKTHKREHSFTVKNIKWNNKFINFIRQWKWAHLSIWLSVYLTINTIQYAQRSLKNEAHYIIFKYSVPTSKKIQCTSLTNSTYGMQFRKISAIYSNKYTIHINTM